MRSWLLSIILLLSVFAPAVAGPFGDGHGAFQRGSHRTAFRLLKPLAEEGDVRAQTLIAILYANGEGVSQDFAEALKWNLLAAQQGSTDAQTNLGLMLHYGQGVERDVENAIRWYRVAAERGNSMAQLKLGLTYDDGDGVAKDQAEAAEWYLLAARQGDATAQRKLAYLYATGQGIEPDAAAAFDWYAEAAKQALSEVWAEIVDMKWFIAVIATIILVFWSIAAGYWMRFQRQLIGPLGFRKIDGSSVFDGRRGLDYQRADGHRLLIVGNEYSLWAADDTLLASGKTYLWVKPLKVIRNNLPD
jgi:uncharacterized protein